jgi:hypothetical protein
VQSLRQGSLLVAQEDITDFRTGEVLIRKGAHMMYLERLESNLLDLGHKVIDATTLKKFILDAGVQIVDSDGDGTLFVVRAKFYDLPIHGRHLAMDGNVRT